MAPIEAPLKPTRPLRGLSSAATFPGSPAQASLFDPRRSADSSILVDDALQIVRKDNRQGDGSPGRSRVCKSVSSPARRQDQVIDLEIVPIKVGDSKQRKRRREDDDDISSLSEESKEGREETVKVRVVEDVIVLDDDEEPQLSRRQNVQVSKRKRSTGGDGAKAGKLQRADRRSQDNASQSVHRSRPQGVHSTGLLGQKRKSDHIMRRKSPSKVLQPPVKAPRLAESTPTYLSSPSAPPQGLNSCPTPREAKLQPNTREGRTTYGPRRQPSTSTALLTSLRATTQFHQTAPKTAATNSNPSTSPRNAATLHKVNPTNRSGAAGSAGSASASGIGTTHARDGSEMKSASRPRERQSLPFRGAPVAFRATPTGKSLSQSHLPLHGQPKPKNRALGFRKVVTNPCPSSAADHRKLGDISPPSSGAPKRFNSIPGSTEVTRSSGDVTKEVIQDTVMPSGSSLASETRGDRKPSNSANPSNITSQAPPHASKGIPKEQNYNSLKLFTSRAKQAVNVTPGTNTHPPKYNFTPFTGIRSQKSVAASSLGKCDTGGSKSPLANSSPGGRRAFTPVRGGAASDGKEVRTLGAPLRRRFALTAQRVGEAFKKYTSSASVPQTFAEKWSKKAEQLLERQKPKSNEADVSCPNSAVVRHERLPRDKSFSRDALQALSKPVLDSRISENKVRKTKSIQLRRMPPFQPVRRRADRPRTTSATPGSFPDSIANRKLVAGSEMQRTSIENGVRSGAVLPGAGAVEVSPSPKKGGRISDGSASDGRRSDQISTSYNQGGSSEAINKEKYQTKSLGPRRQRASSSIQDALSLKSDSGFALGSKEDLSHGLHGIKLTLPVHIPPSLEIDSAEDQESQRKATSSLMVGKGLGVDMAQRRFRQRLSPMMATQPFAQRDVRAAEIPPEDAQSKTFDETRSGVGQVTGRKGAMERLSDDLEQLDV